ncbi:MAG TPA: hypothetical protein VK856_11015 [Anaerolineaceae bacterium]|nr:hypothetical protein [Anaerolineaceae bacterium]
MKHLTPTQFVFLGLFLVILGVVLPFLMVMGVLESTLFLNFFSFFISLAGIIMGVIGSAYYVRINRKDQ